MIPLLLALASQATLEPGPAVPLPCKEPILMTASSAGKFIVVAEAKKIHVLDGGTLKPVHAVDFECTAVGFDAKDETLTVVGTQAVRFETKDWKETFRADLPDVELRTARQAVERIVVDLRRLEPEGWVAGQALVTPDGGIYYRSKGGRLSLARESDGKLVGEAVVEELREDWTRVERVFTAPPGPSLVQLSGTAGVVVKGKVYTLAGSSQPLAVGIQGDRASLVTRKSLNTYSTVTWKNLSARGGGENEAAVLDAKRDCFYIACGDGLCSWDGRKGSDDKPIEGVAGNIRGLAIDGAATRLYGVEKEKLRSWHLKD